MQAYKHQGLVSLVLAYVLGSMGLSFLIVGAVAQKEPPKPESSSNTLAPISDEPKQHHAGLEAAKPLSLSIPAINVESDLTAVAKNEDGTVEVPRGSNYNKPAWYQYSPTPGEVGSSVILGHVDSAEGGPSIFFNLGALKSKDRILIKRADNTTVIFQVNSTREYPKDQFPTADVYGASPGSTLKLITCSGEFDKDTRQYKNNTIVFASLVGTN